MSNIIVIAFNDFKRVIANHRLFYYEGEDFFDFQFLIDGMIIKSTLPKSLIANKEQFFSDQIFYNSVRLLFQIPNPEDKSLTLIGSIRQPLSAPISTIDEFQPVELKNEDIQRTGVE